jgi:Zn-dependent protease
MFVNPGALLSEKPSPFDLRWRMLGTYVRVKWMFWIVIGVFGYFMAGSKGLHVVAMFVLAAFLSVMVHEFGHILAGRLFGFPGVIVLHMWGGGAIGEYGRAKPWQRIIIAMAGPAAGGLFYLLVCLVVPWYWSRWEPWMSRWHSDANVALIQFWNFLIFMGLFWTVFNLVPVLPQDGGMIMKDLLLIVLGPRSERLAYLISFLAALGMIAYVWISSRDATYTSIDRFFELAYPPIMRGFRGKIEPTLPTLMYGALAFFSFLGMIRRNPPPDEPRKT